MAEFVADVASVGFIQDATPPPATADAAALIMDTGALLATTTPPAFFDFDSGDYGDVEEAVAHVGHDVVAVLAEVVDGADGAVVVDGADGGVVNNGGDGDGGVVNPAQGGSSSGASENVVTGSLSLSVPDATIFANDPAVEAVLTDAIANSLSVDAAMVDIISVTAIAARRVEAMPASLRKLQSDSVAVEYEVTFEDAAAASAAALQMEQVEPSALSASISSGLADAGLEYSVTVTAIAASTGASTGNPPLGDGFQDERTAAPSEASSLARAAALPLALALHAFAA